MRMHFNSLQNVRKAHLIILIIVLSIPITIVAAQHTQFLFSYAANTHSTRVEAASASLSGPVSVVSNTTASNGQALQFYSVIPSTSLVIYNNAVSSKFYDYSYGLSAHNPCDTTIYTSSPCSYAITYTRWGAINFSVKGGKLNTSSYTSLDYNIHTNGQPLSDFSVTLLNTAAGGIHEVVLSTSNTTDIGNGWKHVSIPMSQLNPSNVIVNAIHLNNTRDQTLRQVNVDDVTLVSSGNTASTLTLTHPAATTNTNTVLGATTMLPGEQIWNNGASSYIFGTNNTELWASDNIETDLAVQQALKNAHVPLIRTWFFDCAVADCTANGGTNYESTAEEERRLKTDENIGAQCLGVLADINNLAYNEQVVRYAGNRCLMYEFGNEPDGNGISLQKYVQQWNSTIPLLRKINPDTKFIGPVTYNNDISYIQGFLSGAKSAGNLPDAVSFHDYPCWNENASQCLATGKTDFTNAINQVRQAIVSTIGTSLPVGITEWNADPGDSYMAPLMSNASFVQQFTTTALNEMVQAKLDFANQFTAMNGAGWGSLDMFIANAQSNPQNNQWPPYSSTIAQYYPGGVATPTPTSTITQTPTPQSTSTPTPTNTTPTPTPTNGCSVMLPTGTGVATATIMIPSTGSYIPWTRMMVSSTTANSYYLQMDNECPLVVTDNTRVKNWDWVNSVPTNLTLSAGSHTVAMVGNQAGVKIDELIFSQSCTPTGTGGNCLSTVATPTPTPTQSAVTPTTGVTTPTPSIPSTSLVIYNNAVSSKFYDYSYGLSAHNPCDTTIYTSSPCSYAITYTRWGAINFSVKGGKLNTSSYTSLDYNIHTNGQPLSDFSVTLLNTAAGGIHEVVLSTSNTTDIGNGWKHVSIPMSQLNPSNVIVNAIHLNNTRDQTLRQVNVDDVTLVGR